MTRYRHLVVFRDEDTPLPPVEVMRILGDRLQNMDDAFRMVDYYELGHFTVLVFADAPDDAWRRQLEAAVAAVGVPAP